MKKVKRMLALLAAFALVLAMAVPALADGANQYTISVPTGSNHTYKIYQIFTGDYSKEGTTDKLSNVKWGQNSKNRGEGVDVGATVSDAVLQELASVVSESDTAKLAKIEKYADLTGTGYGTISAGQNETVPAGYYLFKDTTEGVSGELYVVEVVGNVSIKAKNSNVPDFEKKLKDANDTDGTTSDWQDVADHDIGDEIPFKLQGTVAADYAEYSKYYFAFHDKEEQGLTFNENSVKVYLDNNEITTGFEVKTSDFAQGEDCTFEVIFNDLKQISGVHAGSVIRVEYTATLNEKAVIGGNGNLNKAQLEYSNNPRSETDTDRTVWDNVVVFTYQVVVNKYANSVGENNKLAGAEFTLTKKLKDSTPKVITAVKSPDGKQFTFKGLDDGEYTLTETVTPEGYNTIEPITFNVSANHEITWEGTGTRNALLKSLTGNQVKGEITFEKNANVNGSLVTDIINKSGTTLPSTGGMGTTVFYVVGGGLMAVAVVLLVTKKRMENKR